MSNATRKDRNELRKKINELKDYLVRISAPKKYLEIMDEMRPLTTQQRFGLVFEHHSENILIGRKTNLVEKTSLRINNGMRMNLLIEGENLVALNILKRKYRSRIDVICIDPPYNTGMDWLNYGDHEYGDNADSFPHSKWLSFMNNRLRIAYDLLSKEGIMFINIDEHEIGPLLLLAHQLFKEKNVDVLIWPKTDPRFDVNRIEKPPRDIKIVHEYILVCFRNRAKTRVNKTFISTQTKDGWVESLTNMETIIHGLGTTSSAKDEMGELFVNRLIFQTPKPVNLIKELIRFGSKPNSIILDFFAGSGTTGHATMDLNKEDGGRRTFILVTNNENNICRRITYERLKRAIRRNRYKETLRYYRLASGNTK